MARHTVCKAAEVEGGKLTEVIVGRSPVVLSRLPSGEIRAVGGRCPHQGAALRHGCVTGTTDAGEPNRLSYGREGEILRCPWHGFEFSLVDGQPTVAGSGPGQMRLRVYDVEISGDEVVVVT
ncbi:MAG: Rieske (2Fe-2S) protein [Methylobacterium organophilum]|jgi:nitrite reductase/ring-hydroxylating ferredoxin subunit|nr:Rieske (2Fe-2S) protein [Methylobacterium organophilum]